MLKFILACALACAIVSTTAEARTRSTSGFHPECNISFSCVGAPAPSYTTKETRADRATKRANFGTANTRANKRARWLASRSSIQYLNPSKAARGMGRAVISSLTSIQCGPRKISVANSASTQFAGFCTDFYASYKWKAVGGWRRGPCHTGSKHPCGGAIDIAQSCRSRGPGHCLPRDFPVALSERLAHKWGLKPGSEWRARDTGHFEVASSLAGRGWAKKEDPVKKEIAKLTEDSGKSLLPKDQSRPPNIVAPVTVQVASVDPAELPLTAMPVALWPVRSPGERPAISYQIYSEIQPKVKPVVELASKLKEHPVESPRSEIKLAAALFGLPYRMLASFAHIESGFKAKARTGSYKGLFQLSQHEFKRYGAGGNIYDARANTIAAANKFLVETAIFEHGAKRPAVFSDIYLIHQQGIEGAAEHVAHPNRVAWRSMCATKEGTQKGERWCRKAIWLNVPSNLKGREPFKSVETTTSAAFVSMWRNKVNKFAALL